MSPAARDKAHRLAAAYSALGYVAIEADDATGQGGAVVVAAYRNALDVLIAMAADKTA